MILWFFFKLCWVTFFYYQWLHFVLFDQLILLEYPHGEVFLITPTSCYISNNEWYILKQWTPRIYIYMYICVCVCIYSQEHFESHATWYVPFCPKIWKCFNFNENWHHEELNDANFNGTVEIWAFWLPATWSQNLNVI